MLCAPGETFLAQGMHDWVSLSNGIILVLGLATADCASPHNARASSIQQRQTSIALFRSI